MQIVTVVVTATPPNTPTPVIITEIQTVVVTATPEPSPTAGEATATPPASATATAGPATAEVPATAQVPATQAPTPPPTTAPPTATAMPTVAADKYPPPALLIPSDSESFTSEGQPVLRWERVGELAPDEYYEVTIERIWQNDPYYAGSDWTRDAEYIVPKTIVLNTSDTGVYTWWVTVKRLTGTNSGGGKVGEPVSPPSESRTFTWQ